MPSTVYRSKSSADVTCSGARLRLSSIIAGLLLVTVSQLASAKDYQSYDEAMADAKKALDDKNYLASEDPLEAAVELAADDGKRVRVYRMLFEAYKLHPEIDKMLNACEFIMDHSTSSPEKSLTRSALLTFVRERGKADDLIAHFEKRLEKDEQDRTSLFVLSEAYSQLKRDPEKSVTYIERLAKVIEDSGEKVDVITYAQLASLYVKSKNYQQGAELYEKIAPQDEQMAPWHWKEAAAAWLKAGEKEKALAAAMKSTKLGPESRAELLNYFWNNTLGDIYLELDNPKLAVPHYENALKATKIKGYLKTTQENLDKAKEKAK